MQHYNINIDMNDLVSGNIDRKLKIIQTAIDIGSKNGIKKCEEMIIQKLLETMESYELGGSNLSGTIQSTVKPTSLSIRMGSEYFMFVEYGTGVVGMDNKHPLPDRVGWVYDEKERGQGGWWYPSSIDDPNPTAYRGETGWWAWTKGQASRPFMYETWLWAMEHTPKIIADEIGVQLQKLERWK